MNNNIHILEEEFLEIRVFEQHSVTLFKENDVCWQSIVWKSRDIKLYLKCHRSKKATPLVASRVCHFAKRERERKPGSGPFKLE